MTAPRSFTQAVLVAAHALAASIIRILRLGLTTAAADGGTRDR